MGGFAKFLLGMTCLLTLINSFFLYASHERLNNTIILINGNIKNEVEKLNNKSKDYEASTNEELDRIIRYVNENANSLTLEVKRNSENFEKTHNNFQTLNNRFNENDKNLKRFKKLLVCTAKDGGSTTTPSLEDYNSNKEMWDENYNCE